MSQRPGLASPLVSDRLPRCAELADKNFVSNVISYHLIPGKTVFSETIVNGTVAPTALPSSNFQLVLSGSNIKIFAKGDVAKVVKARHYRSLDAASSQSLTTHAASAARYPRVLRDHPQRRPRSPSLRAEQAAVRMRSVAM